jgi:hypothetical protein
MAKTPYDKPAPKTNEDKAARDAAREASIKERQAERQDRQQGPAKPEK